MKKSEKIKWGYSIQNASVKLLRNTVVVSATTSAGLVLYSLTKKEPNEKIINGGLAFITNCCTFLAGTVGVAIVNSLILDKNEKK